MPRLLVINWNARTLRYVHTDADRQGRLRIVDAGQDELTPEGEIGPAMVTGVQQLVRRLKAEKSKLLILMNRGSVDSATFSVPPANESELPALVQNMAVRDIPGATEQTPIDFIAYPKSPDGTRIISAMTLVAEDHALVRQLIQQSGCKSQRVLISTHPLRVYVPELLRIEQKNSGSTDAATLIVSRGNDVADVLLCADGLPLLSRTIRLAADVPQSEINRYLRSEMQRTLISAGGRIARAAKIAYVVIVGNEGQTGGLDDLLADHFQVVAAVVRPNSLLADFDPELPFANVVNSGSFAPLLAAAFEEATSVVPAIDFANPRRPPVQTSPLKKIVAVAATLLLLGGGGFYYVWSQFNEIDEENARLTIRLNELNEIVKDTQARRSLVTSLSAWEKNRISWPDELRDLTERIPSSPNLTVQQLTISSAGAGTAVATFRGVGKSPEVIATMENKLRDKYHVIRVPGVREQQDGNKVVSTFQATLTIRKRSASQYVTAEQPVDAKEKKKNASAK